VLVLVLGLIIIHRNREKKWPRFFKKKLVETFFHGRVSRRVDFSNLLAGSSIGMDNFK
jgi:hypothetical protein